MAVIALWPVSGILLAVLLWWGLLAKLDHDRDRAGKEAVNSASSLSKAYAGQLSRAIQQIDQITLHVQYDWSQSKGTLDLQKQSQAGLYPASAQLYVTILNRDGVIVDTTLRGKYQGVRINLARKWFDAHKAGTEKGLFVSSADIGLLTNKTVVRFTRRLNAADGSFDGVAMVTAEQAYLASFTDKASLRENDLLIVAREDGHILAAAAKAGIHQASMHGATDASFLSRHVFAPGSRNMGTIRETFADGEPAIVAWHRIDGYPLVSIVALSEKDAFAAYLKRAEELRIAAIAGTLLLLAMTAVGTLFSVRLASRKNEAEEVKSAYRLATDGAREGFYMLQPLYDDNRAVTDFLIKDCNEQGAAYYGMSRDALMGKRLSGMFSSGFVDEILPVYRDAMGTGFHESEVRTSARSKIQVEWMNRRLVRSGMGLAVTLRDISESKAHHEALSRLANTDAVTRLPNRHWLMGHLPHAINEARAGNATLALLFVDLDDFKNINDTLGHAAGDELLQAVALRLRSIVRAHDNVARLGGDEFTIVLERIHGNDEVSFIAKRLIESFAAPFVLSGESRHYVSASVGISLFPEHADNAEALLKHADIAMYAAKSSGKDQYEFYQAALSENLTARLIEKRALRQAIESDQFLLYYQPRVGTTNGELRSMEALVRWMHPVHGLLSPDKFIPIAEESGLIVQLGDLIIKKACRQLAHWKARRLPVVPISINVSPLQFGRGSLGTLLKSCVAQYELAPSLIQLEITESCMMGQNQAVTEELAALEVLGIELFVDDFGTGYSSMSQLQSLRLDGLKVDRAFTARLGTGKEGEAFFMAILSMARVLGMAVVAEGVETEEQLRVLQALSCNEVQGYFISKPVPADEAAALMRKRFLFPIPDVTAHLPA